ncbi:P-loop containing nucleoside triphosphate hydrolase protein [Suhomyces tanzawaensis NRRL Y-17324]|uniref:p-loop containing nucleoside triphosphate hydrolase protein n=1 Tax=Suhomyces tanzawaensis NRRL Y-17324 TaxID=984487 RepID=A0A1E4SD94_9ASCO|nr:P-loop containing nucleoside triphosphate hydrolase protein [Suhomyces tanzawaensis NRRL Y-17324]ODV77475.1 P-loop containing nucleoside triphosphate hydrolase protein [Suhomyces tanzawaensis NRRL Y-17324]
MSPTSMDRLLRIFAQINTHLTFLAAHSRSTISTIELLQKLNPAIVPLDLAIIKHLMPPGEIFFDYCDENQLMLSFIENVKFEWSTGYQQTKNDVYENIGGEQHDSRQLLVFDFQDTKMHGIGAATKKRKRNEVESDDRLGFFLSSKDLKMQGLTNAQLLQMIQSRNKKFNKIVTDYCHNFTEDEINQGRPWQALVEVVADKIPQPPDMSDPLDSLRESAETNLSFEIEKPSLEAMITGIKEKPFYKNQIVGVRTLTPAQEAKLTKFKPSGDWEFHPDLKEALYNYRGISIDDGLYSHQTEALEVLMAQQKKHVIISTSTSSGKSLIYQLPILNDILWNIHSGITERSTTAIFVFPTKALAQDQKRHLQEFINYLPSSETRRIIVETYDGDTPAKDRHWAKSFADIIFTNPDTIHASILPNHDGYASSNSSGWGQFLKTLKYVVMDELHVYKGTFGVHVSYVMARLNRICNKVYLNNSIRFISCSATIMNPISHFRTICAIRKHEIVVHVSKDGSPCGEKKLIVWNPPPLMNKRGQHSIETFFETDTNDENSKSKSSKFIPRENIIPETARLLLHILHKFPSIRVIVFCPIRVVCELLIKEVKTLIQNNPLYKLSEADVMSYRGGYSKSDRRTIEQKMFSGQLRAIIATNALELGIDLSDLDVVITCGFPMLKLNLHQQFGRAGRSRDSQGSLAFFVGGPNPIDQHYIKNIDELCDKSTYEDLCVEGLLGMGSNELIMEQHLQCSSYEFPISTDDMDYFAPDESASKSNTFVKLCRKLLYKDAKDLYRTNPKYLPWPSEHVTIRSIENSMFAVVDITNNRNVVIEEVEASRTSFTLYEGGIFLHQGMPYLVKEFNYDEKFAKVTRVKVDWTTSQRDFTDIDPVEIDYVKQLCPPDSQRPSDIPVYFGKILTTIIVFGFFKVNRRSEILEVVEVNNPPIKLESKGFWIDIPNIVFDVIKEKSLSPAGGIHAAQHAIMNILPLFINGGASTNPNAKFSSNIGESELMTECKAPEKEFAQRQTNRKRPARLIFHDTNGGEKGSGISLKTFEHIDDILHTTYMRVRGCECDWGCPGCVTALFCKEMLQVMSKPACILILAGLLGYDLSVIKDEVLDGPEANMPDLKVETIQTGGLVVKFSPDLQILEVRKATKKLMKVEEVKEEIQDSELDFLGNHSPEVKVKEEDFHEVIEITEI